MNLLKGPITDRAVIQGFIPQHPPFVMVDRLVHFAENEAHAGLLITENNILAEQGRFTAAGLIEHMAQTIALHTGYDCYLKDMPTPTGYIGAIKDVMIHSTPPVGSVIQSRAKLTAQFMQVTMVDVEVLLEGTVIASCSMKTVIADQ